MRVHNPRLCRRWGLVLVADVCAILFCCSFLGCGSAARPEFLEHDLAWTSSASMSGMLGVGYTLYDNVDKVKFAREIERYLRKCPGALKSRLDQPGDVFAAMVGGRTAWGYVLAEMKGLENFFVFTSDSVEQQEARIDDLLRVVGFLNQGRQGVQGLVGLLEAGSSSWLLRSLALEALRELGDRRAVPALVEVADSAGTTDVREDAVWGTPAFFALLAREAIAQVCEPEARQWRAERDSAMLEATTGAADDAYYERVEAWYGQWRRSYDPARFRE